MDLEPATRSLFLAPLASHDLRALNTTELEAVFRGGEKPLATGGTGVFSSQPTAFRWSKEEVMFIGLAESSIACWRLAEELCSDNFVSDKFRSEKSIHCFIIAVFNLARGVYRILYILTEILRIILERKDTNYSHIYLALMDF